MGRRARAWLERRTPTLNFLLCALVLMWPAWYNGYPLLYSDTGTYVASGMGLWEPTDRPWTYGLFIRITSIGGFTLWTTVFCQAAILVWLLRLLLRWVTQDKGPTEVLLLCASFGLALLTSLPWVLSQVMADIFTPFVVLSAFLLMFAAMQMRRAERIGLFALFAVSVAAHLSHLGIALGMLVVLALLRKRFEGLSVREVLQHRTSWLLLGLTIATLPVMHRAMTTSRNVYFMGALVEHGIARSYLDERCVVSNWKLCRFKDELPQYSYQFVWDEQGAMGAYDSWEEASEEFDAIIGGTFSDARFLALHAKASLTATADQLVSYDIGDGWGAFTVGTWVHQALGRYMRRDLWNVQHSRQYDGNIALVAPFRTVHHMGIGLSALLIIWGLWNRSTRRQTLLLVLALGAGILLNAFVCGTFSGALHRLGCKMIGLLPVAACLMLAARYVLWKREADAV